MPELKSLTELQGNRKGVEAIVGGLLDKNPTASRDAGMALCKEAASYGLDVKDFLILAVDPTKSEHPERFKAANGDRLNGFEAALVHLNLPVRDDFANGVVLQAAANTFDTFDGTRAMFPAVFDQILRFANRINVIETVAPMLSGSRVISSTQLISTIVDDDSAKRLSYTISEGGEIPVRTVKTTEQSVQMYKHGSGYRFTYEFGRRAGLDVLTPFAARVTRQLELSKVRAATGLLINGDGVQVAAPVVTQGSFTTVTGLASVAGTLQYKNMLAWLVARAKAGVPVDTIIGNYEAYVSFLLMFSPVTGHQSLAASLSQATGIPANNTNLPQILQNTSFVLSSDVPASQLIGITKGETLEELVEAGASITESERAVTTQILTFVKTEVTGYRLPFGDTRSIYDYSA